MEYWMASNETGHNGTEETIQEVLRDPGSAVLFVGYPPWLLHFAAGCCILFMVIGIPGNLFTIVALFRTKKLRNATAIFIMNLSLSDLMFCCFNLPLATSTFWHSSWRHGPLLCQLFPLLRYGLVAVSLFSILAITINRYVMIGHPRFYPRIYKSRYITPMILSTWTIAFGALVVTWFGNWGRFGLDVAIGSCSILPDVNGRSPKEFLFVVAFLIPCIAIVVCYARIFYIVRKTACKSRNRNVNASTDAVESNHERRSISPRIQEEELSVVGSSCAASVLCANFSSKCTVSSPNRLNCSSTPSRSAIEESLSEQLSWEQNSAGSEEEDDEDDDDDEEGENEEERTRQRRKRKQRCKRRQKTTSQKLVDDCDRAKPSFEIKIDDIPYVDDLDAAETVLANDRIKIKESAEKASANARNKLERMTSRASFVIDSALWVQRFNCRAFMDGDRLDSSRSNTPDRLANSRRRPTIARRESRFTGVQKFRNSDGPPRMSNKDKKLLKMILVIFSSFLVCYLPITVTKTFKDAIDWRGLNIASYILIYLTTCINPVVYVVMSSEYRSAYKNLLLCRNDSGVKNGARRSPG
ncbi:G-protein coupled receptor moody [Bombus huntii]|uniref:G-protein coupled receptor moody n=1 Tax=Bombus huntii TaxID=85661 RepID=UPI0021AA1DD8|nr:G-protein coupled receptor moody [Bombus huntii]XP_050476450.1 G-protein coupled receptor moody [Bombus huntii]